MWYNKQVMKSVCVTDGMRSTARERKRIMPTVWADQLCADLSFYFLQTAY